MSSYTATRLRRRAYADASDLARMQELLREGWRRRGPRSQTQPGDLAWWMTGTADPGIDWSTRIALWEDPATDETRGWAWFIPPGDMDWYAHPDEADGSLRRDQLDWFMERVAAKAATDAAPERLTIWAVEGDDAVRELLRTEGFEPRREAWVHRLYSFGERPVPEPRVPVGYSLWSVGGEADLDRRVEVHRAAFAPSRMTVERYTSVMAAAGYAAELDLVAVAPDGTFAAFCLVWWDPQSRVGLLEPVGTHPDHRRRGLATAVCTEALRRLQDLGAESAVVLGSADEAGPARLYEGLGFREVLRSDRWSRAWPP